MDDSGILGFVLNNVFAHHRYMVSVYLLMICNFYTLCKQINQDVNSVKEMGENIFRFENLKFLNFNEKIYQDIFSITLNRK